jgi:hypothetical protein
MRPEVSGLKTVAALFKSPKNSENFPLASPYEKLGFLRVFRRLIIAQISWIGKCRFHFCQRLLRRNGGCYGLFRGVS